MAAPGHFTLIQIAVRRVLIQLAEADPEPG
jgi:hypothetical protein